MNLELTSDQLFMRDEARRLLASRAGSAEIRKAIEAGGFDRGLWGTVASELGWCAVALPESAGGLGFGAMELVLLAEEIGRRLAPVPFWSTACLAAPMIAALAGDRRDELLGRIAGGAAATVALDLSSLEPCPTIRAKANSDGYLLDGSVIAADLPFADFVLVPAELDGHLVLFVFEASEHVRALQSLDLTRPLGRLELAGYRVPAAARMDNSVLQRPSPGPSPSPSPRNPSTGSGGERGASSLAPTFQNPSPQRLRIPSPRFSRGEGKGEGLGEGLDRPGLADGLALPLLTAKLGLAAEQVGAAQGALDLTLAYIAERVQFGRTIASFQAVKHRCAELVVDIAEARSLLYGAATSLEAGAEDAALEITAAGVFAAEALFRAAQEAIQLHGGVGNTWEYDPHLYLRRAQASAALFGAVDERLESIACRLLGAAA
jgi:alkylation response protein AidB-like acyl-CoA dehydrogenase